MMLKIAHMRQNRKANKGFSLVELIIVMAIMVALVAVLAPQYIRYLTRSRNAVVTNAAEDILTAIKTDVIDPDGYLTVANGATGTLIVKAGDPAAKVSVNDVSNITLKDGSGETSPAAYIEKLAGISTKTVKSTVEWTISVTNTNGNYSFTSSQTHS